MLYTVHTHEGDSVAGLAPKGALFLLKRALRYVTPPLVWNTLKRIVQANSRLSPCERQECNEWLGDYPDWQSACRASGRYDSEEIFMKVRDASRAVRDGKAIFERDSVRFNHIQYSWPLLAGLMWTAVQHDGELKVIDFGGSLGSSFRQNRLFFQSLKCVRWNIIEQEHVVRCGRDEFQTDQLRFYESIESCLSEEQIDCILFSSVLQYLEDPYTLLEKACNYGFDCLILDRTPFSDGPERITVQHVPRSIYKASYPCRFLDRKRVESILSASYTVLEWFEGTLDGPGFWGGIAQKRKT